MFLEEDGKLLTPHDRNPPAFYPCSLLLWPWVSHLNFLGPGAYVVYEDQCNAKLSQQGTRPSPRSKMEILPLTYLTRIS